LIVLPSFLALMDCPRFVVRYLLDASQEFPFPWPSERVRTEDWASSSRIVKALGALPQDEQDRVLRYHRPCDAALSLGSYLLKHLAVVNICNVSWPRSTITQDKTVQNGKPYFKPGGTNFNVSHHGDLVVLAAAEGDDIRVGIDVVRIDLDKDAEAIYSQGGWTRWSNMFADMFSPLEMEEIRYAVPGAGIDSMTNDVELVRRRLRLFYAHWALKEAYIKMTGDALMATWLKQLEFVDVKVPEPSASRDEGGGRLREGQVCKNVVVKLYGQPVDDVYIELGAYGTDYIVATAVSPKVGMLPFKDITFEGSILNSTS